MATGDPRALLADALDALGEKLRHHRDLGFTDLPLDGDYLLGPTEALRAQERAVQGCRKCKLCEGRSTIVFGSTPRLSGSMCRLLIEGARCDPLTVSSSKVNRKSRSWPRWQTPPATQPRDQLLADQTG